MHIRDIDALINIRKYLWEMVESPRVVLSREDLKLMQKKITDMDKFIVEKSLKIDFSEAPSILEYKVESTEDPEVVLRNAINQDDQKAATNEVKDVVAEVSVDSKKKKKGLKEAVL